MFPKKPETSSWQTRAQTELKSQNERLELVLDLTNRVVSNLDLRDLLRTVSASVRRVMKCDAVGVALPEPENNHFRFHVLDFPPAIDRVLCRPHDGSSRLLLPTAPRGW
jgi:transcriptional regulator with GAF, ATPase, and Fis domain